MATTYVTLQNLQNYNENLKTYIDSDKTKALKYADLKDNKLNFYVDANPAEGVAPIMSLDMPVEYMLDQEKTVLVQEFAWSEETYAGSTNPSLDGKAVLVLAVKGDNNSVAYSFLSVEELVDLYTGENTKSIALTVGEDNKISAEVIISAEEGNILTVKEDGLYVSVEDVDISGKADKLVNPADGDAVIKAGQIFIDDGNGNLAASGITIEELRTTVSDEVMGNFDTETDVDSEIDGWF